MRNGDGNPQSTQSVPQYWNHKFFSRASRCHVNSIFLKSRECAESSMYTSYEETIESRLFSRKVEREKKRWEKTSIALRLPSLDHILRAPILPSSQCTLAISWKTIGSTYVFYECFVSFFHDNDDDDDDVTAKSKWTTPCTRTSIELIAKRQYWVHIAVCVCVPCECLCGILS